MQRRLTTIVAADVAGYSRLVGVDEEGTLAAMRALRAEVIDPLLSAHGGRVANTAGDSLLIEFPSAVEAVRCAIAVQEETAARSADMPEEQRILFRVGVNVGDVVAEGEDLLGDGVNVAARLEAMAPPGGIVLSGSAYDQVRDKLDAPVEEIGKVEVKNIARPVHVYQVRRDGEAKVAAPRRSRRFAGIGLVVAAGVVLVSMAAWQFSQYGEETDFTARGFQIAPLPDGPRIVVLPFANLSGDPEHEIFVDGLTEDLITQLAHNADTFVIARNSAFKYKGKSVDVRDVGRDLGIDFVVEGSVRRSGDTLRVKAQLSNASDGATVWTNSYDRGLDAAGVFEIQDALTIAISAAIGGDKGAIVRENLQNMRSKQFADFDAYECTLLSNHYWHSFDPGIHERARACLEREVKEHPGWASGWAHLSTMYRAEAEILANPRPNPLERSLDAAERSISLDPDQAFGHRMRALVMNLLRREADARSSLEQVGPVAV